MNAVDPATQRLIPAARKTPHRNNDTANPPTPVRIIARRPDWSERRAHSGAAITHSSAETEKAAATAPSATCSVRPNAGNTDCSAVLPAAIVSITTNSSAKSRSNTAGRLTAPSHSRA